MTWRAMLEPMAQAKGLLFSLQRAPGTPRALRGDAGRVRQILLNLGCNAIKFTESGEVALRSAATPHGLMLEISDTGAGMEPGQVERLFQRFEQADGLRTAQRHGGSGLGLAICQELAVAMNGRIDVQSAARAGHHAAGEPAAGERAPRRTAVGRPRAPRGARSMACASWSSRTTPPSPK